MTEPSASIASPQDGVSASRARPVFVTGIMPRSGTNYTHRLLCLHPDCSPVSHTPVKEDFLLHHSDLLDQYADRLAWHWGHWGEAAPIREALLTALGRGLGHFLTPSSPTSLVITKTPSVRNLGRLFDHLPDARLLILIRDGRSIVASGMKGFEWDFETATHRWATAAQDLLSFRQTHGNTSDRHIFLRYEDLNADPESALRRIFEFLEIAPSSYNFADALDLPVYGSSYTGTDDEVSWTPQSKPESFGSTKRWADWSDAMHARFNWIAERELTALGYEPKPVSPNWLYHSIKDARYKTSKFPRRLREALREGVYAFSEALQRPD